MIEVIQASEEDVIIRSSSKSIQMNQVGIRCRFCAHLAPEAKVNRSSAFPSSIDKLYQSCTMVMRDHFPHCPVVPLVHKNKFLDLKDQKKQGGSDTRDYWAYSAKKIGMKEVQIGVDKKEKPIMAIFYDEANQWENRNTFGLEEGSDTREAQPLASSSSTSKSFNSDKIPAFIKFFFSQLQVIEITASERKHMIASNKVKRYIPNDMLGLGCRYCCAANRMGYSRKFPLERRALADKVDQLFQHMRRCRLCPMGVRKELNELYRAYNASRPRKSKREVDIPQHILTWLWQKQLQRKDEQVV